MSNSGQVPHFEPVPLPTLDLLSGDRGTLVEGIKAWAISQPIRELVDVFGGSMPQAPLSESLRSIEQFSADHWDFRSGEERNLAHERSFSQGEAALIGAAAVALGMTQTDPPRLTQYDHVLILGGLLRACLLRPRYTASLVAHGLLPGDIAAIGGFRPLKGNELELAKSTGLSDVDNEIEAMDAGVRRAFGLEHPALQEVGEANEENPNSSWLVRHYEAPPDIPVRVVAAPSSDPDHRRANTPDTYTFWASEVVALAPMQRILLVTTPIYVPFQHCDAIRMLGLPYRVQVETVGIDVTNLHDDVLRQTFTPANFLQEVRSALRSMLQLYEVVSK